MITIDITINDSGKVTNVIMDGHANHGEYGHDIVWLECFSGFIWKR